MAKFSTDTRGMKKTYYDKTNRSKEETRKTHTHIYIYKLCVKNRRRRKRK